MLLIFFLVTSSMDTDKGLLRQLPPLPDEKEQPLDINKDHVMTISLDGQDQLAFDGAVVTLQQLPELLMQRIEGDRLEHVVAIETHRETTYEAYFRVQNAVVKAYGTLRDQRAKKLCGKPYAKCGAEEREDIEQFYPMRISETMPGED